MGASGHQSINPQKEWNADNPVTVMFKIYLNFIESTSLWGGFSFLERHIDEHSDLQSSVELCSCMQLYIDMKSTLKVLLKIVTAVENHGIGDILALLSCSGDKFRPLLLP